MDAAQRQRVPVDEIVVVDRVDRGQVLQLHVPGEAAAQRAAGCLVELQLSFRGEAGAGDAQVDAIGKQRLQRQQVEVVDLHGKVGMQGCQRQGAAGGDLALAVDGKFGLERPGRIRRVGDGQLDFGQLDQRLAFGGAQLQRLEADGAGHAQAGRGVRRQRDAELQVQVEHAAGQAHRQRRRQVVDIARQVDRIEVQRYGRGTRRRKGQRAAANMQWRAVDAGAEFGST